jgi:hypothetical protein
MIYCIGDSHVSFFSGNNRMVNAWPDTSNDSLPFFKTYRLGPVLAYSLSKEKSRTMGRQKLFEVLDTIPKGSKLLFVFGEIDCRLHLLRQANESGTSVEDVVETSVQRYISVLKEVQTLGYRVMIWHVIPSTKFKIKDKSNPTYGTCLERNDVTQIFNNFLHKYAQKEGIEELSIYNKLIDDNNVTKMYYYYDAIHLSQRAMPFVIEELAAKSQDARSFLDYKPSRFSDFMNLVSLKRVLKFVILGIKTKLL